MDYKHGERRALLEPRAVPGPPTAVAQTADGIIWIGTAEKGLFRFNPEKGGASLLQVPSLKSKRINCLLPLANAGLLVGTKDGLYISRDNNSFIEVGPTLEHNEVLALANGTPARAASLPKKWNTSHYSQSRLSVFPRGYARLDVDRGRRSDQETEAG